VSAKTFAEKIRSAISSVERLLMGLYFFSLENYEEGFYFKIYYCRVLFISDKMGRIPNGSSAEKVFFIQKFHRGSTCFESNVEFCS
jgi:hypothetical protein